MADTTPPIADVPSVTVAKVLAPDVFVSRRDLRWYLIGFGSVGLLVGFFAGLSDSPVVSTLLPLILATIGGTGGLYLASFKSSSAADSARLGLVGKALGLFTLACILAACYGISIRKDAKVASFIPGFRERPASGPPALPASAELTGDQLVSLAATRAQLEILGVPAAEQSRVLDKLTAEAVAARGPAGRPDPVAVLAELTAGLQKVEQARQAAPAGTPVPEEVIRGQYIVQGCAALLNKWVTARDRTALATAPEYLRLLDEAADAIEQMRQSQTAVSWFAKSGVDYTAWFGLNQRLRFHRTDPAEEAQLRRIQGEEMLSLLRILHGKDDAKDAASPKPRPPGPSFAP